MYDKYFNYKWNFDIVKRDREKVKDLSNIKIVFYKSKDIVVNYEILVLVVFV